MRVILLCLLLASCSATDLLSIIPSDKPSIEANVAIGKTNVQNKSLASVVGEDKRQIADAISNTSNTKAEVINNNTTAPWLVILGLLGWVLPTPMSMWSKLKGRGAYGDLQ